MGRKDGHYVLGSGTGPADPPSPAATSAPAAGPSPATRPPDSARPPAPAGRDPSGPSGPEPVGSANDNRRVAHRQPIAYTSVIRPHATRITRSSTRSTMAAAPSWLTEMA